MAPPKQISKGHENCAAIGIKTRSHITTMKKEVLKKRKSEDSPNKNGGVKRRAALVDIKNQGNTKENPNPVGLKTLGLRKTLPSNTVKKPLSTLNTCKTSLRSQEIVKKEVATAKFSLAPPIQVKVTESKLPRPRLVEKINIKKSETFTFREKTVVSVPSGVVTRKASLNAELEKSESSLYVSALEDLNLEEKKANAKKQVKKQKPPSGVYDYDLEQMNDLGSVAMYTMDIFNYLKKRESHFKIDDYMTRQTSINKTMRALLVDWMVEIQENFELNHETLYLAVKMVDLFLCKVNIKKEELQLIGCTCLFVASKFDERIPPLIEDFLYACDSLYEANDIITMEQKVLKVLNFELGIPLSYRFLRRYARCAKFDMPLLTLARYILEYALMDYALVTFSDSKMASAALYLAIIMKDREKGSWTTLLEYYSGYKLGDFKRQVMELNACLHQKPNNNLRTIRTKYAHKVFFESSKIPLVDKLSF